MQSNHFIRTAKPAAGLALALGVAVLVAACGNKAPAGAPPSGPAQVVVHTVAAQPMTVTTELAGRTSAFQMADVRPQVGGLILKRLFVEGSTVKAGTPLYQIDPASFVAAVNSAKATLASARAKALAAEPKAKRYKELLAIEGVSKQDLEDALAAAAQARAEVDSAQAALDVANINLKYTNVYAPISGHISRSNVTAGALVTAGQADALTTVQQLDPIYVDVTQSSTELLALRRRFESGKLKRADGGQASVSLLLADGSQYAAQGKLQFADVSVDAGTGNVTLRALFPNPKGELMPGMYVRAVLDSGLDDKAITVPQVGVTRNQRGEATALVLNKENKVEQRVLSTGAAVGDKWVVNAGLAPGDRVIVEGLQQVLPGAPAVAVPAAAPAAAAAGASAASRATPAGA
ncbi:efflux RND transporter periplasmic adaptor subunit [Massilia sp. CCM 8734]|uniref:efflux RND transporter periplasmic adaptor subunit n=1 Tax=Massilia sp. CCM 8734 TaxID=2609283 RepID=UPI001420E05F|nr:efflux RND transporter periplasmic adaptor subunit [Massilia sp. CCM 8734]NHZ96029.1 efflux RND transporter periplasmic adaptor subunit [Massilia sp. CCM 8734]